MPTQNGENGNSKAKDRSQRNHAIVVLYLIFALCAFLAYRISEVEMPEDFIVYARWYSSIGVVLVALYAVSVNVIKKSKGAAWLPILASIQGHIGISTIILACQLNYLSLELSTKADQRNNDDLKGRIDSLATSTLGKIKETAIQNRVELLSVAGYIGNMEQRATSQHNKHSEIVRQVLSRSLGAIENNIKTHQQIVDKTNDALVSLKGSLDTTNDENAKTNQALQENAEKTANNLADMANQLNSINVFNENLSSSFRERDQELTKVNRELLNVLSQLNETLKKPSQIQEASTATTDSGDTRQRTEVPVKPIKTPTAADTSGADIKAD